MPKDSNNTGFTFRIKTARREVIRRCGIEGETFHYRAVGEIYHYGMMVMLGMENDPKEPSIDSIIKKIKEKRELFEMALGNKGGIDIEICASGSKGLQIVAGVTFDNSKYIPKHRRLN